MITVSLCDYYLGVGAQCGAIFALYHHHQQHFSIAVFVEELQVVGGEESLHQTYTQIEETSKLF